jgi:hypothetical protein
LQLLELFLKLVLSLLPFLSPILVGQLKRLQFSDPLFELFEKDIFPRQYDSSEILDQLLLLITEGASP